MNDVERQIALGEQALALLCEVAGELSSAAEAVLSQEPTSSTLERLSDAVFWWQSLDPGRVIAATRPTARWWPVAPSAPTNPGSSDA